MSSVCTRRGAEQARETAGERGLAAATASVDQRQRRLPDEREQLGVVDRPPRSEVRLLRVQVHASADPLLEELEVPRVRAAAGRPSASTFTSTTRDRAITRSPSRISDSNVTEVRPTAATRDHTSYGSGRRFICPTWSISLRTTTVSTVPEIRASWKTPVITSTCASWT